MKTTNKNATRYCEKCGTKLQRKGIYSNGLIRLYCPHCHKNIRFGKNAAKATKEYHWKKRQQKIIESKLTIPEQGISYSTYNRHKDIGITRLMSFNSPSQIDSISLDGTWFGAHCYLIATFRSKAPKEYPLKFEIVPSETTYSWMQFLKNLPKPNVFVCDGQKGLLKAIKLLFPHTKIQICLFHVYRRIKSYLTLHPKTEAGKDLLLIAKVLLSKLKHSGLYSVKDLSEVWIEWLNIWYEKYHDFINQKTYLKNGGWFRTHKNVWSAYRTLKRNLDKGMLFVFVDEPNVPRTNNGLEGGYNSQIKQKSKYHLGSNLESKNKIVVNYLKSREFKG